MSVRNGKTSSKAKIAENLTDSQDTSQLGYGSVNHHSAKVGWGTG